MATRQLHRAVQQLRGALLLRDSGLSDGQLLECFVQHRDEAAFEALVRRHGPMVLGVCRRVLGSHPDAEDAFQATFLVLVRKAADVPGHAVANWLYGVARQTAVRLRAAAAKRGRRETTQQVVNMPEPTVPEVRDADLQAVVDEELSRLPEHYRQVLGWRGWDELPFDEIARRLGRTADAARMLFYRAVEQLQQEMDHPP